MIYTVTFNPSLDYIVSVKNFTNGATNRTTDEKIFAGGKGINVSMVLKNLGQETTAFGFLAGFTGERIKVLLEEKGICADFIFVTEGMSRINVKLRSIKKEGQEETEINGQGPVIQSENIVQLYQKLDSLTTEDMLVLAGSIPNTMPSSIYMDILQYVSGKGVKVAVDATGELLKKVLPYQPFLVKPNHHELGDLFGVELKTKSDIIFYAKKLKEQGSINVLVSMAGDGAVLVDEDGVVHEAKAPKGIVKNSVGAGDSMVAGFLAGYLEKKNYEDAFLMGLCTGSASAFSEELARKEEVMKLLEEIGGSENDKI